MLLGVCSRCSSGNRAVLMTFLGGQVQEALPQLSRTEVGLGAEQHGRNACRSSQTPYWL